MGKYDLQFASAECYGGGSEINSGLYHEPDKNFLNNWSNKFETNDLSSEKLQSFIKETKEKTKDFIHWTNACVRNTTK